MGRYTGRCAITEKVAGSIPGSANSLSEDL